LTRTKMTSELLWWRHQSAHVLYLDREIKSHSLDCLVDSRWARHKT